MTAITTRVTSDGTPTVTVKGSPLTNAEMDANFINLNKYKVEKDVNGNLTAPLNYRGGDNASVTNTGFGEGALDSISGGLRNTAVGNNAGTAATTCNDSVFIGHSTGAAVVSGGYSVVIGAFAGSSAYSNIGITAIGYNSCKNYTGSVGENTAVGEGTGFSLTTGYSNTIMGKNAFYFSTLSSNNTVLGRYSGHYAVNTWNNTYCGDRSGMRNGDTINVANNLISGYQYQVVAVGSTDWTNQGLGTTPAVNTIFTAGAVQLTGTGTVRLYGDGTIASGRNVVVGNAAGAAAASANSAYVDCVFLGADTVALVADKNAVVIGYGATSQGSNKVVLGNSSITAIYGAVTTITSLSDARDKTDVQPLETTLAFVNKLRPVRFNWNTRDGAKVGTPEVGFIAQDLLAAQADLYVPNLVDTHDPEKFYAAQGLLIPVLVKAVQELSSKVTQLEAKLAGYE